VATIKDVARVAGVHPATASRALNPLLRGRISAATTAGVEAAAAELGYVVDPIGRSLRTQRSGIVGVLVPDLLNPFYPPLLRGVQRGLRGAGFEALIGSTDNDVRREPELLAVLRGRRCEAPPRAHSSGSSSARSTLFGRRPAVRCAGSPSSDSRLRTPYRPASRGDRMHLTDSGGATDVHR
jgi:hypothetical protein